MNTSRKLYRSNRDKMVGGVCGGIAEYFEVDSTLVRIIAALLVLFTGFGIVPYIVLWVIIPKEPSLEDGIVYEGKRKRQDYDEA